jgi:excisionase family DNA binding protein
VADVSVIENLQHQKTLLTAGQLAEILGVAKISIYKWVRRGVIPAVKIGTVLRFDGLFVARALTGKAFRAAEDLLRKNEFSHQWAIADWMLAGEQGGNKLSLIFDENDFGQKRARAEAEKVTGMTRETLQQFAHTARKVLIRVKGVSFNHHRLVAKLYPDGNRQKKELHFALKNRLSVEQFDLHLKGLARDDARHNVPTNTDVAAKMFMKRCDEMVEHLDLKILLSGEPPAEEHRETLVKKIKETAAKLNDTANQLENQWQLYLQLPPIGGFRTKEQLEEWKSHKDWREREKSAQAEGRQ